MVVNDMLWLGWCGKLLLNHRDFVLVTLATMVFLAFNLALAVVEHPIVGLPFRDVIAYAEGFTVGTFMAQVVILALWAGLRPGHTLTRTCYALLMLVVAAILMQAFVLRFTPGILLLRREWGANQFGWLFLVVLFSAVQLHAFAIRRWTGYFLAWHDRPGVQERAGQVTLAELVTLPVLFCAPLVALTAILDAMDSIRVFIAIAALLFICALYAGFHLWGFLRPRISVTLVTILFVIGPIFLLPASLFFTGQMNGSIFGIPFFYILCCTHGGALIIGVPTAGFARLIGYQLCRHEGAAR